MRQDFANRNGARAKRQRDDNGECQRLVQDDSGQAFKAERTDQQRQAQFGTAYAVDRGQKDNELYFCLDAPLSQRGSIAYHPSRVSIDREGRWHENTSDLSDAQHVDR